MQRIFTAVALIAASSLASFAAESKKEITARQIVGTWKNIQYSETFRTEGTSIYSSSGKNYLIIKHIGAHGSVTESTQTSTYSVDDDGNLLIVAEPDSLKGKLIVDWLDQNTVMLRLDDLPPLRWKRE